MGQRVNIVLFDDIDGSVENVETFRFGLDGKDYEIDVTREKAEAAREALSLLVKHAHEPEKEEAPAKKNTGVTKSRTGATSTQIRNWAKANGVECNSSGRVPQDVIDKYDAAMGKAA